jgi:hypothetical protein
MSDDEKIAAFIDKVLKIHLEKFPFDEDQKFEERWYFLKGFLYAVQEGTFDLIGK